MDNLVRLESLTIESIKNVKYGELSFDQLSKIKQGGLNNFNSVLDIYGQNGAGKTTALGTAKILKNVLSGEKLPKDIRQYISNESHQAKIECMFYIKSQSFEQLITYTFINSHHKEKWLSKKTLFEAENNEIILKRLLNEL